MPAGSQAGSETLYWPSRSFILTVGALILFRNALTQLVRRGKRSDDNSLLAILERVIRRFRLYFMIAMGLAAASIAVAFPETVQAGVEIICIFAVTLQFAEWAQEAAVSSIRRSAGRAHGDTTMLVSAVNIIKWFCVARHLVRGRLANP